MFHRTYVFDVPKRKLNHQSLGKQEQMSLPNFLIIGAPRSGTTWLAMNLREHPDIFMPQIKEVHYFDRHYAEGIDYYLKFFRGAESFRAVGEATPDYLYFPEVPERIASVLPESKMILCLRDPVDRVYSRYWNAKAKYTENRSLSFEQKLRQKPLFLDEGKYFTHVKRYYEYFAPEQFLILSYDEIQSEPDDVMRRAYEFLDVDSTFRPETLDLRVNAAASKPHHAKSRSLYYLHRSLEKIGLHALANVVQNYNAASLPSMSEETRRWLVEEVYRQENLKLQQLTGLDVSQWN